VIIKKTTGQYTVNAGGEAIPCDVGLRGEPAHPASDGRKAARKERAKPRGSHDGSAEPDSGLAVGDRVHFQMLSAERGRIVERLPRRNHLGRRAARPSPNGHASEQVIAANLHRVVAVLSAAQPAPKWNLLDRYLVSAEAAGLPALVCLTKADLALDPGGRLDPEMETALDDYRRAGYPVIITSAADGQGLETLRRALGTGVSALVGKSGVGKTSLLNALQPGLGLRVRAVSQATEKGRHTTTHLEMFPLDSGGALVDTPGMREFGLWDVAESDLALHFPEMRPYVGRCKFGLDCRHDEEPGCAVRRAVMAGAISPRRYQSFQRLRQGE
jgi:ribosome biogenesis GTPase